jgi:hypothetical protein
MGAFFLDGKLVVVDLNPELGKRLPEGPHEMNNHPLRA